MVMNQYPLRSCQTLGFLVSSLVDTLKPLPLRILPTKPRSHAMMKHVWLATLRFDGRVVNLCTIPVRWRGRCYTTDSDIVRDQEKLECLDASQSDGDTREVELLFAACTREAFLVCALGLQVTNQMHPQSPVIQHGFRIRQCPYPQQRVLINAEAGVIGM